jgi:hypothetical protein
VYTLDPEEVLEDVRLPQGSFSSGFVLHYYAAVNALTGLIKLVWVTGTTGVNHGSTTMVRPSTTRVTRTQGCTLVTPALMLTGVSWLTLVTLTRHHHIFCRVL